MISPPNSSPPQNTSTSDYVIPQLDGNMSINSSFSSSNCSSDNTVHSTSSILSSVSNNEVPTMEQSWFSQISECDTAQPNVPSFIPVMLGYRPKKETIRRYPAVRQVIRRENKCIQALSLPTILSYNMRSIWGKIRSLAEDMHEREGEICFLSEVWEKQENKKHKQKIVEMLEMSNISYISTPRPGAKRGGGAGIAINTDRFSVTKLDITIPKPLEIVWAMLRPIEHTGVIRRIILCSLYSPPNSKKNILLIDHISLTYNCLKTQYPDAAILISGDKNDLDEKKILALNSDFRQLVSSNTRQNKILTILITDLQSYYHNPIIIPPVPVDVPGQGVPSDHCGVLAMPVTSGNSERKADVRKVTIRPLPDSLVTKFGSTIVSEDWSFLEPDMTSTELVNLFENHTKKMVEDIFPEKSVTISNWDKPFMTEELKKLRRQRQRVYRKGGRCKKYLDLKLKFDNKLKQRLKSTD